ncbi:hypothetical protein A200_02775 [Parascardovia denticolens IPLA 20019]|nr:hypothetical protein A200_02775 [Parascardovia denticolens IPLA 20019]EQW48375.1 hypothetical protein HMPREF9017_01525 [Parascardovia denticolens F0305]
MGEKGGKNDARKSTTRADISHNGSVFAINFAQIKPGRDSIQSRANEGEKGCGIEDMPLPNDIDITGTNQAAGFAFFFQFRMESRQFRGRRA